MASYDSPGFTDRTPAGVVTQSTVAGAGSGAMPGRLTPQSAEAMAPAGEELGTANLTGLTGGSVSEDVPQIMATVHANDVLVPSQVLEYGKSSWTGADMSATTAAQDNAGAYGTSHVVTPRHPSAVPGSGAGAP